MTMLAQFAAAGGGALPAYIEDVFSTFLYTGTGATQTITNGIDLAGEGGLVWTKARDIAITHWLVDNARGISKGLVTNTTAAEVTDATEVTSFNSNGYSIGISNNNKTNYSPYNYVSWTFRKQPKFFDVVTWTGNGVDPTNIPHNLGSVPGCIIIKCTSTGATDWFVYHRSLGNSQSLNLNQTAAAETGTAIWGTTTPTSTVFTVGNINANTNGRTYVAYLFAHDAGGFGLSGTENVISCGLATVASANAVVTLGWEPQYVLYKQSDGVGAWSIIDSMRGLTANQVANNSRVLFANNSNAEETNNGPALTSTGFVLPYAGGGAHGNGNYIYIAIRRGPMKVPTDGTTVFSPIASSASAGTQLTTNFPVDLQMYGSRAGDAANMTTNDRLRGVSTTNTAGGNFIVTSSTAAETGGSYTRQWGNTGFVMPAGIGDTSGIFWNFRRAPSFFDEVCYTGTGVTGTQTHNLNAVPEMWIVKSRTTVASWAVGSPALGSATDDRIFLQSSNPKSVTANTWIAPTSTTFGFGTAFPSDNLFNASGTNYVAYLFATCAGVSKVGNYTGTGTTQAINCGFTTGARFVLIKRTDSTGDWYVWDSARGIVSGNDPYLLLNSTAAEVTSTDYVDTSATGFELTSTAPAAINASGGSFIFLAIS